MKSPLSPEAFLETCDLGGLEDRLRDDGTIVPDLTLSLSGQHNTPEHGPTAVDAEEPEFSLLEEIGRGGLGVVHRAYQMSIGRDVAIKAQLQTESTRARTSLLHEAWITGALEHPCIVPVHGLRLEPDGQPQLVMKLVEGVRWDVLIRNPEHALLEEDEDDPLRWHIIALMRVCEAVHFAHSRGVIHRDIKPDNIIIGQFGEIYLLDWGIAVSISDEPGRLPHISHSRGVAGTPSYMAPEMVEGDTEQLGVHTDVYLLGATLHEIITGEPPHIGTTLLETLHEAHCSKPHEYPDAISPELVRICHKAMHRDPAQRFPNAQALRRALSDFLIHRSARSLAERAQHNLELLRSHLASDTGDVFELHRLMGACRLGYEESLRLWPDNTRAREELDDALTCFARYELAQDNLESAKVYMAELSTPHPELESALEAAQKRVQEASLGLERLQRLEHDANVSIAGELRARNMLILGGFWVVIAGGVDVMQRFTSFVLEPSAILGFVLSFLVLSGALVIAFRKSILVNAVNVRLVSILFIAEVATLTTWLIVMRNEIEVTQGLAFLFVEFWIMTSIVSILYEPRLLWGASGYLVSAVLSILFADFTYLLFIACTIAFWGGAAWIWWKPASSSSS